jgi:glycosyltransferase involved in cell wall biosynthesis
MALIREVMASCQCLASPSRRLLEKYGCGFERVVFIEEPVPAMFRPSGRPHGAVHIGFAGSIDRAQDVDELLNETVEALIEKYGDRISVEFFGAKPELVDRLGLKYIPYMESYTDYLEALAALDWDIGLAPMPDSSFHACKHYIKYEEYSACGIVPVCSALLPYTEIVHDGENGFLCSNNRSSWVSALSRLIEDRELRERISATCREQAASEFSLESAANDFLAVVERGRPEAKKPFRRIWRMKGKAAYKRLSRDLRKYGWRTPAVVMRKVLEKGRKPHAR